MKTFFLTRSNICFIKSVHNNYHDAYVVLEGGQYAFITKAVLVVVDPYDVMHLSISSRLSKGIKLWQQGLREGEK